MLFFLVAALDGIPGDEWSNLPFLSEPAMSNARHLQELENTVSEVVEPSASSLDKTGQFPVSAINLFKKTATLGLFSSNKGWRRRFGYT